MTAEAAEMKITTLGSYLSTIRREQGLDITAIADQTKISLRNLQAIEEDDYSTLPAEAFTRGFYRLYAAILSLDPDEVLKRYDSEKMSHPAAASKIQPSFEQRDPDVGVMAERHSALPFSSFGLIFFLILSFGAFLCWYFSWNPATFLSHKLRNLQHQTIPVEQVHHIRTIPDDLFRLLDFSSLRSARAEESPPVYDTNLQIILVESSLDSLLQTDYDDVLESESKTK